MLSACLEHSVVKSLLARLYVYQIAQYFRDIQHDVRVKVFGPLTFVCMFFFSNETSKSWELRYWKTLASAVGRKVSFSELLLKKKVWIRTLLVQSVTRKNI